MASDSPKNHLPALTGLRGVAALWVVSLHFADISHQLLPASAALDWITGAGANAVPLFFVLSGFVLLHNYRSQFEQFSWRQYGRFLGLRLARIYPAYLAALLAVIGLVLASKVAGVPNNPSAYPPAWLLPEALMVHCWVRLPPNFFGWNFPDWSVSAEWFAYLFIFPVAIQVLKGLDGRRRYWSLALVLGLCLVEPLTRTEWKVPMVSLLFLAGAILWQWWHAGLQAGKTVSRYRDLAGCGWLILVLWAGSQLGTRWTNAGVLMAVLLIISGLTRSDGLVARVLASQPGLFLGEISYSIYLTHGIVQRVLKIALPSAHFAGASFMVRAGVLLVDFAAVLAAATALYYLVEHPARIWLRRRFSR